MILKKLMVGSYASNCYIVGSGKTSEGIIIDAGAEADRILKAVKELGLDVKFIVLTHAHSDHVGAVKKVREATGGELCLHADDAGLLRNQLSRSSSETSLPDRLLKGGDSIDFGDMHFLVIHTPGHSPGSISLLGHKVVFTGDTLFNYGIGRFDTAGGSYSQIMNSLHTKLMVLPDNTMVYPGHGTETTIGAERLANPFLRG